MIAHRLSTMLNVEQIFVIQDGQVAECGTVVVLTPKDGISAVCGKTYQAAWPVSVQWKVTIPGRKIPFYVI